MSGETQTQAPLHGLSRLWPKGFGQPVSQDSETSFRVQWQHWSPYRLVSRLEGRGRAILDPCMSVPKRNRPVSGHRDRLKTCPFCRKPTGDRGSGRPRTTCGRLACKAAQKRSRRAEASGRWSGLDWLEALNVWRHRCSRCGQQGQKLEPRPRLLIPVLPVCSSCRQKPITSKARIWLARCRWGTPLPRPSSRRSA